MDQLADRPSHGDRVVAAARAGRPESRLGGNARDHLFVVVEATGSDGTAQVRHADAVVECHLHARLFLAAGAELRPVIGDERVEVEHAAVGEHVRTQCHRPLGRGEHGTQGVLLPVGPVARHAATPQVDHGLSLECDRTARTDFVARIEVLDEGLGDLAETAVHAATDPPCRRDDVDLLIHAFSPPVCGRPRRLV